MLKCQVSVLGETGETVLCMAVTSTSHNIIWIHNIDMWDRQSSKEYSLNILYIQYEQCYDNATPFTNLQIEILTEMEKLYVIWCRRNI